jgi:hypothetical protein
VAAALTQPIATAVLARESGIHPDVVRRLVQLGLLEPAGGGARVTLIAPEAPRLLMRVVRLRQDLGLNYAGAILACQLLDRIDELEARLRRYEP